MERSASAPPSIPSGFRPQQMRTSGPAACAGEDYVLLLTADCADAERLAADFLARFGAPLHPVGRITDGRELEWFENGTLRPLDWHGFTHY